MNEGYYQSPVGCIKIVGDTESIKFVEETGRDNMNEVVRECQIQLDEYFRGERKAFDLPLQNSGTVFQEKVWSALCNIPYGTVQTYGEVAKSIGQPGAMRAVGGANNKNNIAIIVPCHRVVNSDALGGYASGMWRKEWLLKHEKHFKE